MLEYALPVISSLGSIVIGFFLALVLSTPLSTAASNSSQTVLFLALTATASTFGFLCAAVGSSVRPPRMFHRWVDFLLVTPDESGVGRPYL